MSDVPLSAPLSALPAPLAQLIHVALGTRTEITARHHYFFYFFEALMKLGAAVAVTCYVRELRDGRSGSAKVNRCLESLASPSLGQWLGMLRELAEYFRTTADSAGHPLGDLAARLQAKRGDLPGLLALFRQIAKGPNGPPTGNEKYTLRELFDVLVTYRNKVIGHGAQREPAFYEKMIARFYPAVLELAEHQLMALVGPPGTRLVVVTALGGADGRPGAVTFRSLSGLSQGRDELHNTRVEATPAVPFIAVLLPTGQLLSLHPLLRYDDGDIQFLNDGSRGKVEYLSYRSGEQKYDALMKKAVLEILGLVKGSAVSEAEFEEYQERSRAETEAADGRSPASPAPSAKYDVLGELGHGGMGVVELARQTALDRLVALKSLPTERGGPIALERFEREIQALAKFQHPNIVRLLTDGTFPDGRRFFAMEYLAGCDLQQVWRLLASSAALPVKTLTRQDWQRAFEQAWAAAEPGRNRLRGLPKLQPIPPAPEQLAESYERHVVRLIRGAAEALQVVHEHGLVHRDVKPANLMVPLAGDQLILMDLGLVHRDQSDLTRGGVDGFLGTLRYAAPEQLASSSSEIRPAADVRALGCILWELLTRRQLFAGSGDEAHLLQRVREEDVPRLRSVDPGFDRDLDAIVWKATEREREARLGSAAQLAEYLQLWLDGEPLRIRPRGPVERTTRWLRRHRSRVLVGGGGVLLLGGIVTTALYAHKIADWARVQLIMKDEEVEQARGTAATEERLKNEAQKAAGVQQTVARTQAQLKRRINFAADMREVQTAWKDGYMERFHELLDRYRRPDPSGEDLRDLEWHYWQRVGQTALLTLNGDPYLVQDQGLPPTPTDKFKQQFVIPGASQPDTLHIACSPDGKVIAATTGSRAVTLWDAATGKRLGEIMEPDLYGVNTQYNPLKGPVLGFGDTKLGFAEANERAKQPLKPELPPGKNGICALAFSSDGRVLFLGKLDHSVSVCDVGSCQRVNSLYGHGEAVVALAVRHSDSLLATGSLDGTVKFWSGGQCRATYTGHQGQGAIWSIAFSPDGKTVASMGSQYSSLSRVVGQVLSPNDTPAVRLWDADTLQERHCWPLPSIRKATVAFADGGKQVVCQQPGQGIMVWDTATGAAVNEPTLREAKELTAIAVSDEGRWLAADDSDNSLRLWDRTARSWVRRYRGHVAAVAGLCFCADAAHIASIDANGTVKLWERNPERASFVQTQDRAITTAVAFAPSGPLVAGYAEPFGAAPSASQPHGVVRFWSDADAGRVAKSWEPPSRIRTMAFLGGPGQLVAVTAEHGVVIWDIAREAVVRSSAIGSDPQGKLPTALSGDGAVLAQAFNGAVTIWSVATGKSILDLAADVVERGAAARFQAVQERMLADEAEQRRRGKPVQTSMPMYPPLPTSLFPERMVISDVALSGDGRFVAIAAPFDSIRIWQLDLAAGTSQFLRAIPAAKARGLALSRDGQLVAAGLPDRKVKVWRVETGEELATCVGPPHAVSALVFSPTGQRLAVRTGRPGELTHQEVALWDPLTGQQLLTFPIADLPQPAGNGVEFTHALCPWLAFSADGMRLASGSLCGTVHVWDGKAETSAMLK